MEKIYLDANYLIYLFVPNNPFQAVAIRKLAQLRLKKCKLFISPLVLDELWYAIYNAKKNLGLIQNGIKDCHNELKNSYDTIKNYGFIKIIQLKNPLDSGVNRSLELINEANLKPRDAFHLATAENHTQTLLTNDGDFLKMDASKTNIKILDFTK